LLTFIREKFVWNLEKNACPVAGHFVCAGCAAVVEIQQYLPAIFDYRMVFIAIDVHDRTDAAGVVFPSDLVKALVF
jgi:hypothetical protein